MSLYPDSMFADAVQAAESPQALEALADRWGIVYGLGNYDGMLGSAMMQSQDWLPLHHGLASTLFVRRSGVELVRRSGVQPFLLLRAQIDAGWMADWYGPITSFWRCWVKLEAEIERAAGMTRDAPVLLTVLGYLGAVKPDVQARLLDRIGLGSSAESPK